ncbi:MAG: GNAT family N-acetyltransferase [Pseudomonadota bacterium]|nr:GNAT family N-acetyltransferase [Pseudomonadota bacterium]
MLSDFEANDPSNAEFYAPARADFAAYVRSLMDEERGLNLREGWVPCTHRWLMAGESVVGVARMRHTIDTPFLSTSGGHIGYDVAPSHRRHGHGHSALQLALSEATRLGVSRVLLYAAKDNAASRAVIERQGGELESVSFSEFWNEQLCKYWISVPERA